MFWRCIWDGFNSLRVKLEMVSKLGSIRVSRTMGRGREIEIKSICPALLFICSANHIPPYLFLSREENDDDTIFVQF